MRTKFEFFFQMHSDEPAISSESDSDFGDKQAISTESDNEFDESLPPIFRNVRRPLFPNMVRKKIRFYKRLNIF